MERIAIERSCDDSKYQNELGTGNENTSSKGKLVAANEGKDFEEKLLIYFMESYRKIQSIEKEHPKVKK